LRILVSPQAVYSLLDQQLTCPDLFIRLPFHTCLSYAYAHSKSLIILHPRIQPSSDTTLNDKGEFQRHDRYRTVEYEASWNAIPTSGGWQVKVMCEVAGEA